MTRRWRTGVAAAATAVAVCGLAACGKKGPPLAPIVRIPAVVEQLSARRVGGDVYVSLTIPAQNIDRTVPASVARVDVYAATALTPPPPERFLELASRVAVVPVLPAPEPGEPMPAVPPGTVPAAATQGYTVTVRETLDAAALAPRTLAPLPAGRPAPRALRTTPGTPLLRRFYTAIAFSDRGRSGPPAPIVELPLPRLPDPPAQVALTFASGLLRLSWEPSGGLLGFLLDLAPPVDALPADDVVFPPPGPPLAAGGGAVVLPAEPPPAPADAAPPPLPAGPTRYNVYRQVEADPLVLPMSDTSTDWHTPPTAPANAAPLETLVFEDPVVFGRRRCYEVRAVKGVGAQAVEGEPTARTCVTPVDTDAPAPPSGLSAVATEGAINLLWEANAEADLGGYLILRGAPGDATLAPLTGSPIAEPRYTDRAVTPGVRYVYQVVAVDARLPLPNESGASMRVEETAR